MINKINLTGSARPLIWTSLPKSSPGRSPVSINLIGMFFRRTLQKIVILRACDFFREDNFYQNMNCHPERL